MKNKYFTSIFMFLVVSMYTQDILSYRTSNFITIPLPAVEVTPAAQTIFNDGVDAYNQGNYEMAIQHFTSLLQNYEVHQEWLQSVTNSSAVYWMRAQSFFELRQYQEAIADFTYILTNQAFHDLLQTSQLINYVAVLCYRAMAYFEVENYEAVIADLDCCISHPQYVELLQNESYICGIFTKRPLEISFVENIFEFINRINDNDSYYTAIVYCYLELALLRQGEALMRQNQYSEALTCFTRIWCNRDIYAYWDNHVYRPIELLVNIIQALFHLHRYDEALHVINYLTDNEYGHFFKKWMLCPHNRVNIFWYFGRIEAELKHYTQALYYFNAIKKQEEHFSNWFNQPGNAAELQDYIDRISNMVFDTGINIDEFAQGILEEGNNDTNISMAATMNNFEQDLDLIDNYLMGDTWFTFPFTGLY